MDRKCHRETCGIDVSNQAATDLVLQLGAAGFPTDRQMAKNCRDLAGLLYADGLYCAVGKPYTAHPDTATSPQRVLESLPRRHQASGGGVPVRR